MTRKLVVLVMALALAVPALAQEADTSAAATLTELRSEAQRLTALAQVPEAGRDAAEALLERSTALTESARQQEIARLQAYIAALRNGDSPTVAEQVAANAISAASVELTREREALTTDVQEFLETYPAAASLFRGVAISGSRAGVLGSSRVGLAQLQAEIHGRSAQLRQGNGGAFGRGSAFGLAGRSFNSFRMAFPYGAGQGAEPAVPEFPDAGEPEAP